MTTPNKVNRNKFYLPLDCPECGRARLEVNVETCTVECEKCHATDWDCFGHEHERGGPHKQWAVSYRGGP